MTTPATKVEVKSATPIGDLTDRERKARYTELRKRLGKSRLEVKGKPGIHYFWADKADSNESARLDSVGYSLVREPNAAAVLAGKAQPEINANGLREDGTYQLGDVILMQCSEEVYEFLQLDIQERSEALITGAVDEFKSEAEKAGAPTFDVPIGGSKR